LGVDPHASTAEDGDVFNGTVEQFNAFFNLSGDAPPIAPDIVEFPYQGVRVTRGRRYGSDVQVVEVDKAAIQTAIVTRPNGCKFIDAVAGDIVSNGGDFSFDTCIPIGLVNSEGRNYTPQEGFEPALGFNADHSAEISHVKTSWPNALGLKRYLVVNGEISSNTSTAWNNEEPRTIYGVKADGSLVVLSVRGRDAYNTGHDLFEAAKVMKEFGCVVAGDGDGGGSVQARVKGNVFLGTDERRNVADFVSITLTIGETPMAGRYKCTVMWSGASIRPEPNSFNTGVGVYAQAAVFYASELLPDSKDPANPNKQWAKVESDPVFAGLYAGKYVAVKYPDNAGTPKDRCVVVDTGATPPPPSPTGETFDTFITLNEKDASGNIIAVYEGTAKLVKK
jgi:hypothetical protein